MHGLTFSAILYTKPFYLFSLDDHEQKYQNTKLVKQGTAKDYVKYNVMVMGKFGGTIYYNKTDKSMIASGGESNTTFPPKRFKSIKDAIDYVGGNSTRSYNTNIPLDGMDTSFGTARYV